MDMNSIIIAAIPPFFTLLSLMFTGLITILTLKINKKVNAAKKVNDATHTLVNSNMGIQLRISMDLAERVAVLTNLKSDKSNAAETKRLYDEHMVKQAAADKLVG